MYQTTNQYLYNPTFFDHGPAVKVSSQALSQDHALQAPLEFSTQGQLAPWTRRKRRETGVIDLPLDCFFLHITAWDQLAINKQWIILSINHRFVHDFHSSKSLNAKPGRNMGGKCT